MSLLTRLAKLFTAAPTNRTRDVDELRVEFADQFARFQRLISANRAALESMAEIEEALRGEFSLGINFARSRCANVVDNVATMVRLLAEMAPGKYEILYPKLQEIERAIAEHVVSGQNPATALVIPLDELDRTFAGQVGDKMANLGEIRARLGLAIPAGFVVTETAYWHLMEHAEIQDEIDDLLGTADKDQINRLYELSAKIRQRIIEAPVPADLAAALREHAARLVATVGPDAPLAVRSSAQGEDLPGRSCAGMYRTKLGVTAESIVDAYKEVIASKYETRAMMYRLNYGIRDAHVAMCVGCMLLVRARCGGVAYSRNPLNTRDPQVTIHSVFGLPSSVADGSARSDLTVVARQGSMQIVQQEIAFKRKQSVYDSATGVRAVPLGPAHGGSPSIDPALARELARKVVQIEEHFGVAQDVEWALDETGQLVFLQCRPLIQRDHVEETWSSAAAASRIEGEVLLTGRVTACPGGAAGPVHVVRQEEDIVSFPAGAVLVASQPLPDWAVVMRRAVAVVCEQGSMAGHLANVARELHVPAVFGVKDATEVLTAGQVITVDASRKRIFCGVIEAVITTAQVPAHAADATSAIHLALKDAAQHIVPLRLLDPDDKSKFTPEGCTTLHDITRLCHEKALLEVFSFGAEHSFPERSAKRLFAGGRTQFWVIDLADGFAPSAADHEKVRLEEIRSLPMHALWRGMMTIPWQSPPVNAGGLFEVLLRSTADPGLNPSMPSPYSERNYFMITSSYCSCKTRFGYHFSTVEALVGRDRRQNYVSFNFRGGAAGERRRARRAGLVADILAEHGFRVHTVGDSVHARLEKYRRSFLVPRLEVIGYLMFHTRQLDMVLTDVAVVQRYHAKFRQEIAHLLELTASQR